jgi:hypothetical protein
VRVSAISLGVVRPYRRRMKFLLPTRGAVATLIATAAVSLTACGSDAPSGPSPQTAKASIEKAAGLQLTAVDVPAEARDQGLRASYTNAATAAEDKQVVAVFVLKSAGAADKVAKLVKGGTPETAQLIKHGTVMVVYAPAGADRSDAVEQAVEEL